MIQNELKERIKRFRESLKDGDVWQRYQKDLKEEGVKTLIVVPLIIEHLGFENIDDFRFEDVQGNNQGFADIVLQDKMLIELKKFNLLSDSIERDKAEKQIKKYIKTEKDNIYYGILTDGVLWELFIDKKYIKLHGNENNDIPEIYDDVPLCVSIRIDDDNFLNYLTMLSENVYEENIKKYLIRAIVNKAIAKPGKPIGLHNMFLKLENTDLEELCAKYIQEKIDDNFKIEKGEFFDDVVQGKKKIGSRMRYEDEYINIEIEICKNGYLKVLFKSCTLKQEKQLEALDQYPLFIEYLKSWPKNEESCMYPNRVSLIKALRDLKFLQKQEDFLKKWKDI
jgi:hypothetical protein